MEIGRQDGMQLKHRFTTLLMSSATWFRFCDMYIQNYSELKKHCLEPLCPLFIFVQFFILKLKDQQSIPILSSSSFSIPNVVTRVKSALYKL